MLYCDTDNIWRNKIIKSESFWKVKGAYNIFSSLSLFFHFFRETNFLTCSEPFRIISYDSVVSILKDIPLKAHVLFITSLVKVTFFQKENQITLRGISGWWWLKHTKKEKH